MVHTGYSGVECKPGQVEFKLGLRQRERYT